MKTFTLATIVGLIAATPLYGQYIVYDPTLHNQSIANHTAEIAKFVEVIDNQVDQINKLADQLNEIRRYIDLFGTPAEIAEVVSADQLMEDLQNPGFLISFEDIQGWANGGYAMDYTARGMYRPVARTFTTPGGTQIRREKNLYRQYAAVPKAIWNYDDVFNDITDRRIALKEQIRAATDRIKESATDAETQKLTAVLIGLNAELAAIDKEVDFALGHVLIQQADLENDKDKQATGRVDEQQAEFTESLTNFRQVFRLSSEPAVFPEDN